jgi:hypothetical protein
MSRLVTGRDYTVTVTNERTLLLCHSCFELNFNVHRFEGNAFTFRRMRALVGSRSMAFCIVIKFVRTLCPHLVQLYGNKVCAYLVFAPALLPYQAFTVTALSLYCYLYCYCTVTYTATALSLNCYCTALSLHCHRTEPLLLQH